MPSLRSGANPPALSSSQRSPYLDTEVNRQTSNLGNDIPSPSTASSDELSSHQTDEFSLSEDEDEDESEENTSDNPPERATSHNNISCEFAGTCQMDREAHTHYRKIISHVFGRNKSATKVFPEYVWVHYCRKHYQRARYRAGQWPFTQCDLLIESLSRMQEWGGVKSFQLILRRREQERRHNTNTDGDPSGSTTSSPRSPSGTGPAAKSSPIGRRNPTAVTAPVPDWLLERLGSNLTFNDIREIIRQIRQNMEGLQRSNNEAEEESAEDTQSDKASKTKKGKARRGSSTSTSKRANNEVRFPDIEIIPIFEQWALEDHNISRKQKKNDKENDNSSQKSKTKPSTSSKKRLTPRRKRVSTARTTPSSHQRLDRVNEHGGVKKPSTTNGSNASTRETYQRPPNGNGKREGPLRKR
ncbi:hypothetical protein N7481_012431 [Penicillium waksmanii]|uniref:uncharacterized protein n=1 Tax=Penicillium waksmanii TaxID=69791 RepID=UPI002547B965|nr:uncharacterized protein N7481_012431 [Penicillium waksmanii]KAJ5965717.1 hypothetical protein N7481_012431 [Penicillium waksmanii]